MQLANILVYRPVERQHFVSPLTQVFECRQFRMGDKGHCASVTASATNIQPGRAVVSS